MVPQWRFHLCFVDSTSANFSNRKERITKKENKHFQIKFASYPNSILKTLFIALLISLFFILSVFSIPFSSCLLHFLCTYFHCWLNRVAEVLYRGSKSAPISLFIINNSWSLTPSCPWCYPCPSFYGNGWAEEWQLEVFGVGEWLFHSASCGDGVTSHHESAVFPSYLGKDVMIQLLLSKIFWDCEKPCLWLEFHSNFDF